ncbi:MAG: pentapeptide repeat-containing protein [Gaiellales bacterium]
MRRRLLVLIALITLAALVATAPASAASRDVRAKKKTACSLKKKAKCKKAKLKNVKVGKQNLSGANLRGATITGTTFTGTDLTNVDFSKATLRGVTFKGVALAGASFAGANLRDVRFDHVTSSSARSSRAGRCAEKLTTSIGDTIVEACDASGADYRGAVLNHVYFFSSTFSGADFSNASLISTGFQDSVLFAANFANASFTANSRLVDADLASSFFDGASGAQIVFTRDPSADTAKIDGRLRFASFMRTRNISFDPKPAASDDVRGLFGTASVQVLRGSGDPAYTSISIGALWGSKRYQFRRDCLQSATVANTGNCQATLAVGDYAVITITTPGEVTASGGGVLSCQGAAANGAYVTTCRGSVTRDVLFLYSAPVAAPVMKTLRVDVRSGGFAPAVLPRILLESVTPAGTVIDTKTCTDAGSCESAYTVGTLVRVTMNGKVETAYFGALCPGETGSAIVDGGATMMTTPTAGYNLERVCSAFPLNADTTIVAELS